MRSCTRSTKAYGYSIESITCCIHETHLSCTCIPRAACFVTLSAPCSANQVKAEESLTPPNVVRMSAIGKGKLHHRDSYIPNRPRTSPCSEASLTALRPQHKIKIVTVDNDIDSSRETTLNYIQDELRAPCLKRGELHTQVSCRPTPMMAVQMINESQDTRDQPPSTSMPLAIREADAPLCQAHLHRGESQYTSSLQKIQ